MLQGVHSVCQEISTTSVYGLLREMCLALHCGCWWYSRNGYNYILRKKTCTLNTELVTN